MNLALFDLDHTLLPIDSDFSWAEFLATHGLAGDPALAHAQNLSLAERYHAGTLAFEDAAAFMLGLLARHSMPILIEARECYLREIISPAIKPAALELVAKHRNRGDLCAIVTATNTFVTRPVADLLGVEHLLGTDPELREERYTGRVSGPPCFQAGKIVKVQAWLGSLGHRLDDFNASFFYSDSINDVPLLSAVTHPIATNPSPALREHARNARWPILDLYA